MGETWVIKEDGEREPYDPVKVRRALSRSGLSQKEADEVMARLEPMIFDGITTKKIYSTLFRMVEKKAPEATHKFNLKRALIDIGPEGYEFEDFMSKLLNAQGYDTEVRMKVQGKCVSHEIDVIPSKGGKSYMMECKFHNQAGTRCRIQSILYVYSRFLDLREGARLGLCRKFAAPWLATNTKFSEDVIKYAECMKLPLLGWHYPEKLSLEAMIEKTGCFPVSVIKMSSESLRRLLRNKLVMVSDLPESAEKLTGFGISRHEAEEIIERAQFAR